METNHTTERKLSFEELTKEELIKKCQGLIAIIQKAKQSKAILEQENNKLKAKIDEQSKTVSPVTEELILKLTDEKLRFVSTIEDLKNENQALINNIGILETENSKFKSDLGILENENISFKRQINRLTDENEQLLTHLDSLEKQMEELKSIRINQEENINESRNQSENINKNKISELENMLKISLDEVTRLQAEKNANLETNTSVLSNESSISDNFSINNSFQEIADVNERNEKLKKKLKIYHDKIVKLANSVKTLRENKNEIIEDYKLYTNQVKNWKDKLNVAAEKIVLCMQNIEKENEALKLKVQHLKDTNARILDQLETHKTDDEKSKDREEVETLKIRNIQLLEENKNLDETINRNAQLMDKLIQERDDLFAQIKETSRKLTDDINTQKAENRSLQLTIENYEKSIEVYKSEITKLEVENLSINKENEDYKQEVLKLKSKLDVSDRDLQHNITTEQKLAEKSGEEITKLVDEIKMLSDNNIELQVKLREYESIKLKLVNANIQTENDFVPTLELEEKVLNLKTENAQLLSEMNEMNQALKERGEKNSKLEAHCEEIVKKLQIYETQANKNVNNIIEKDEMIKQLKSEISALKIINKNLNSNTGDKKDDEINKLKCEIELLKEKINMQGEYVYAESDNMSSSTISRADEVNRLKELEGSWEERYGKLRNLALKLKAKIKEQSVEIEREKNEKADVLSKLNSKVDEFKQLHFDYDKLKLELETNKSIHEEQNSAFNKSKDDKNIITSLQNENLELKKDKANTDLWKKQIALKVQALRKELEEKDKKTKDLELQNSKLLSDLDSKELMLKSEMENHQQTKNSLMQSTNENKKNSVLNLEMQDYEKSVKELSAKLDRKQEQIVKLKAQVDSQRGVISALRDQIELSEEKLKSNKLDLDTAANELNVYKKKASELESVIILKDEEIANLKQVVETLRSQNEELSTEMYKDIMEHQKLINSLKDEKENLLKQNLNIQQNIRELQQKLHLKEEEFEVMYKEYETYKVRAQSVLRQNQSRDIGLEEKLNVDVTTLKSQVESLEVKLKEEQDNNELLQNQNETLKTDHSNLAAKYEEISNEIIEVKHQYNQLLAKNYQTLNEHNETVRSLKVHTETLAQCYRQQLQDQEVRHNREIIELQSKIEKAPTPEVAPLPVIPTMPREEGEGSESIESAANNVYPVPLEKLLGDDDEQQLNGMKKQINEQESKIMYLTELLADTEQDLAKHVQMNKVLKEEIRRQQRAVEREKHAENLEYLKNIVFKFVTLNSGDERTRLVPVLNTILKLSPEETQKLNLVAKGDPGFKAWSYLPGWSPK